MKKTKFAAQVLILIAAFPILFVAGISKTGNKTGNNHPKAINDSATASKMILEKDCICKSDAVESIGMPVMIYLNN